MMKKNQLLIILATLTLICIFSIAALADGCGCRALTSEESKDTEESGAADGKKEEEPPEEEAPPEEEKPEEPPEVETPPEEEPPEEEQPDEGEPAVVPTLDLEIYEGPTYSPSDGVCYYRIKANVSGNPAPIVEFSKDDSNGAWGQDIAQINLEDPADTYNLTVTATNSEGTVTDSMNLVWGCTTQNNPPEISEITLMGNHYAGLEYTFSAAASDPDGDTLTYSWSVSGGTLVNPNTNPVKWTMPASAGSYEITVTVDDGNGGEDQKTESIEVIALPSISVSQIPGGGWIYDGVGVSISPSVWVGDDMQDRTERGFLNFDISGLAGKEVVSAEMKFTQYALAGDPYSIIEKIRVEAVYWGTGHIEPGDYYIPGVLLGVYDIPTFTCLSTQLTDALNQAIDNGYDRFQIRLSHKGYKTNHNGAMDRIKYGGSYPIEFNVIYMP